MNANYTEGALGNDTLLIVGPGGGSRLSPNANAISAGIQSGAHVLGIGLDEADVTAFLPNKVAIVRRECIGEYFETFGTGLPFTGLSPADTRNRDPREIPLVAEGGNTVSAGALATADGGSVVLDPACSGASGLFRSEDERKAHLPLRCTAHFAAVGEHRCTGFDALLLRFSTPVRTADQRYRSGFYLDEPEEWDDPYRLFRW